MAAQKSNNPLPPPGCFSEQSTEESAVPQRSQGSGDGMGAGQKAAIRIGAELAQDYIEKEPGEQWRVLSFSYPYLAGGSDYIPFSPLKHRATDELVTSLECVSGPDKGLCVDVGYRRWEDPASFHSEYEESRDAAREDADTLAAIEASGLLKGRLYTFNEPVLYIWPTGEDDPLRNPETFADVLRALRDATGDPEFGLNLILLEKDAPAILQRQFPTDDVTLSERHVLSPVEAVETIALDRCQADSITFATADELLKQSIFPRYADKSSSLLLYGPSGYLVREQADSLSWNCEEKGRRGDAELAAFVGEQFGIEERRVIDLSLSSRDDIGEEDESSTWTYHIAIPRGVLEESPESAEDATRDFARESEPCAKASKQWRGHPRDPVDLAPH